MKAYLPIYLQTAGVALAGPSTLFNCLMRNIFLLTNAFGRCTKFSMKKHKRIRTFAEFIAQRVFRAIRQSL